MTGPDSTFTNPTTLRPGPIAFDDNTWLYLVQRHGAEHGLGDLAREISVDKSPDGKVAAVDVNGATALHAILSLRDNKHMLQLFTQDYLKSQAKGQLPETIAQKADQALNPNQVLHDQKILTGLGYNIGVQKPDGVDSLATEAAAKEFQRDYGRPGKTLEENLNQALARAQADVKAAHGLLRPGDRDITLHEAYAMRDAATKTHTSFDNIVKLASAERAFEKNLQNDHFGDDKRQPGLIQMTRENFLATVKDHGQEIDPALGDLARHIIIQRDSKGQVTSATVDNPAVETALDQLRQNPRISAGVGAEYAAHNPAVQVDVAKCYLGETPGSNLADLSKFIKKDGGLDIDRAEYCAQFANSCLGAVGITGTQATGGAWTPDWVTAWPQGTHITDRSQVRPGDIVTIHTSDGSDAHTAMVASVAVDHGQTMIRYIGGNQGGESGNRSVALSDPTPVDGGKIDNVIRPPPNAFATELIASAKTKPAPSAFTTS